MSSEKKGFTFLPRIINGEIAGIIGVMCVYPINVVKILMEIMGKETSGMWDCGMKTLKSEGVFSLYRGMSSTVIRTIPMNQQAIELVANDYFRYFLRDKDGNLTLFTEGLAGGCAGMCQIIIISPMDQLVVYRAVALTSRKVHEERLSVTKIAMDMFRKRGIFGLYEGMRATFLRDVSFSAIYFPLFAHLNHLGIPYAARRNGNPDRKAPFWVSFLSGCAAGTVAAASVTPFEVVRTRMHHLHTYETKVRFNGIIDCFRKTYHSEGFSAFFKGVSSRVMVIGPLSGIAQAVYYLGVGEFLLGVTH